MTALASKPCYECKWNDYHLIRNNDKITMKRSFHIVLYHEYNPLIKICQLLHALTMI